MLVLVYTEIFENTVLMCVLICLSAGKLGAYLEDNFSELTSGGFY